MPLTASTVRGHARDTQQQQRQQHHHHHHPSRNSSSSSADTTHKSSRGASISFDELVYLNHVLEEDVRDDGDGHRRGGVATTVASRLATAAVQKRGSRVPSPDAVCFDELLGACTVEGGYVLDVYTALLSPDRGARASESGSTPHAGHQHPSPRQEQRSRRVVDDGEGGGGAGGGGGAVEAAHPTHPHYSHHRHQRRAAGAGTGETVAPSDITAASATLDRHRGPLTRDLPTQSTASAARELERTSACTAERSPPHQQQQQQQEQQRRLSQPLSSTAIAATASAAAACAVPPTLFEGDTARRSRTAHVPAATTDTGATAAEGHKCRRVADAPPSLTVEAATASVAPLHHRPSRGVAAAQQPQHTSSSFDNGRVLSDAAAAAAAAAALGGGRRGLEESLMSQQGRHPIAGGTETTQSRRIIDGGVAALDRHPPNTMSTNIGFWDYVDPRELSTMEVTAGPWRHGTLGGDSGGRNVTDAQDPPHTPQSPAHPRMGILSLLPPRGSVVSRPPSAAATASGRLGGPPPPPRPSRPHMSSGVYSNRGYYSFGFFASSLRHGSAVVGPTALPVGGGGDGRAVDTHAEVMRVEHVPAAPTTMTRTHGRRRTSPPAAPPPPQPSDGAQHAEAPPPHGGQSAAVSSGGVAARRPEISFFTLSDMPAALTAALTSPASQPVEPHDTAEAEAGEGRSTACRNRDDCGGRRSGAAASDVAVSARHRPTATEAAQNHPTAPRGASEDAHPHHSQTPDRVDDGGYGMRHLSSETSTSSSSSSSTSSSSRESNAHYNYGTQFRFQYRFPSTSPAADDGDGGFHRAPEDSAATAEARTSPTAPPPSLQPRRRDHISSTTTTTTDARSYASGLIRNAGSLFSAQHGSYGDGFYTSLSCLSDDSARLEDVALHSDGDADRDSSGVPHRNSDGSHDDHDDDGGSSSDSDATEVDRESRPSSGLWVHGSILTLPFEPQVTETASRVDGVSDGAAAAWSSSSGGAPVAVVEANDAPRREVGVVARSSLQRLRARGVAALTEPRFGGGRPASEQQQQQSLPPYGSARCGTHPTASLQLANGRRPGAAVVSGREPVPALSGFAPVTPNGGDGNTAETAWWVNGSRRHTVSHTKSTAAQQCVPPPPPACMDGSLAESAAARDACALLNSVAANNWLRQSQRASAFANERDLRQHGWLGEPHHAAAACPPHTSTIVNHGNTPRGGATRSGTDDGESVLVGMRTTASSPSPKQQQQQQQQHPQPHPWPAPQVDPTSGAALTARARWFMFMALEIRWVPSPGLSPDERDLEVPPAAEARQEDDGDADDDGQHPFMLE